MTLETRECNECKIVKPTVEFNKRQSKCKTCQAQYVKERAEKFSAAHSLMTLEELRERTPQKKCGKCKQVFPSTEFNRCNSEKSGLSSMCRSCANAESSTWHSRYKEQNRPLSLAELRERTPENYCWKCEQTLPSTQFSRCITTKSGLTNMCRSCISESGNATRARNKEQNESLSLADLRERTPEKNCWKCEQVLPSTEFNRDSTAKSGLSGACRDCDFELGSEWQRSNPEKCRERNSRYRAKKRGLFWQDFNLDQILERDGTLACAWCGILGEAVHLDHVRPLDLDGIHMPDNLVASCPSCNSSKRNLEPAVWLSKRLKEGWWNIPSPAALKAVQMAYSGVHEELKTKIDNKNQMALAA